MFFSAGFLLVIVQQPENQKTTRPFVELTDRAESFFRLYLKCQHKQIAGLCVKAAGCPMAKGQNALPIAVFVRRPYYRDHFSFTPVCARAGCRRGFDP
ncbi:hypothetical protein [Pseudomonas sp. NPDC008258]|uniref:hypothetical protein n=1 Tax=unclassified Pseudomonas TaxID=196821 RepID=UPI0036EF418D